jgi:hypothetical protein
VQPGFDRPAVPETSPATASALHARPSAVEVDSDAGAEVAAAPALHPAPMMRMAGTGIGPGERRSDRPRVEAPAAHGPADGEDGSIERGATAPQLRRFIKSRAYVPMHELRRRFAINGGDDEVTTVEVDRQKVYVGLPEREGRLLGDLLRGGDIGYELSLDPISPIVVGVYPMRPVTRA